MRRLFPSSHRGESTPLATTAGPKPAASATANGGRSRVIRIVTTFVVVAVLAAFLAAVATKRLPLGATTTNPIKGGSIVVGIRAEPSTLLPQRGGLNSPIVDQALWAPLWYGDPQGILHPGIAAEVPSSTNGDISTDLTTWTIHLRPGLKWSDGTPLTADDCVFTFTLYLDPTFGSPLPATDPTTFVLKLKQPYVGMVAGLEGGINSCLPKEVFGGMTAAQIASSSENERPSVVSGPFMIKERVVGDHVTMVRNPYYYQGPGKPYLDQITFKPVSQTDALAALQTHAIDTYHQLDFTQLPSYRAIPGYTTYLDRYPAAYEMLMFNLTDPLMSDRAVRQAITMGIDRNKIIADILNGAGKPTCDDSVGTFAHEGNLTCYPFDPAGANSILDADGWIGRIPAGCTIGQGDCYRTRSGKTLEIEYAATSLSPRGPTQALIRDELKTIGMKIDLKVYPNSEFFGLGGPTPEGVLAEGHFQIAEAGDNHSFDPDDDYFFGSDAFPEAGGQNYMRYVNPEVDAQERIQEMTADVTAREAAFHIIHADVLKDLPLMYLYAPQQISCARSDLHNYDPSPEGAGETWNVWDWWLEPKGG